MMFANPYLLVELTRGSDPTNRIALADVFNGIKAQGNKDFQSVIQPYEKMIKFSGQNKPTAPFVSNCEIEFNAGTVGQATITFELPAPLINVVREELFAKQDQDNYDMMWLTFGYPEMRSDTYGFKLIQNASVVINDFMSTLTYTGVVSGLYPSTPSTAAVSVPPKIEKNDTVKTVISNFFQSRGFAPENIQWPSSGKGDDALNQLFLTADAAQSLVEYSIIDPLMQLTEKLALKGINIRYYQFADPSSNKVKVRVGIRMMDTKPSTDDNFITLVSRELMYQVLGFQNGLDSNVVLPILGYEINAGLPATPFSPPVGQRSKDPNTGRALVATALAVGKYVKPADDGLAAPSGLPTGNVLNRTEDRLWGFEGTFETLLWPHVIPLETEVMLYTPIEGFYAQRAIIKNVKYSLIGQARMSISIFVKQV